jgi:lipoprotein-anchoring transpeptidase ErfK/SrfK
VNRGRTIRAALLAASLASVIALPGALAEAKAPSAQTSATGITLSAIGKKGKPQTSFPLLSKVTVAGLVAGYTPGEQVDVTVSADGRELLKKQVTPKSDGGFEIPLTVNACCRYVIEATSGATKGTTAFTTDVPKKLGSGPVTNLFNDSLRAQGFHTGPAGSKVTIGTHLAIKAFRKVNHMSWSEAYRPSIFRTLLQGKGAFEPRFDDGKHVEVDISRQVMALVEGDTPVHVFHVSTGTGGTPTVQGNFRFYMKQPGYNAKQMYYSVYFIAGYATHGYADVPNHNASHGCVRNPIPFSRFIYNWIDIGDPMHVYS